MIRFPGTAIMMVFLMAACSYSQENMNDIYNRQRQSMVERQIEARGVRDTNVLQAMRDVERHRFVPSSYRSSAYGDHPLSIGEGQTISQPYIVALMTESLELDGSDKVLEIGTGSGYQAAILGEICDSVFSIEIFESLYTRTSELLKDLGYTNIFLKHGDGYLGWEEFAPFDAIIVTCAPSHIPPALVKQLAEGGRMIIPSGNAYYQELILIQRANGKLTKSETIPVRFVPMIREDGKSY